LTFAQEAQSFAIPSLQHGTIHLANL